jgi:hypothetical protein
MKYIYYIAPFALLLLIGFSFFKDFTKSNSGSSENNTELAQDSIDSSSIKKKGRANGKSLFDEDSKFLEFPELGVEELESGELTPAERERRKKLIIEKSKKLADMFPHNSVIPRELSAADAKKLAETNQKMANIQNQFFQNEKVPKEDKLFYYKERLKTSKDRIEIFRYALGLENNGVFDESKLEGFLKERYEVFLENEKAYANEIVKVEKE